MLQRPERKSRRTRAEHVICRLQIETYPAARRPQACENRKQLLPTASDGASGLIRPLRPIVAVLGPPPAVVPTCQKRKKSSRKARVPGGQRTLVFSGSNGTKVRRCVQKRSASLLHILDSWHAQAVSPWGAVSMHAKCFEATGRFHAARRIRWSADVACSRVPCRPIHVDSIANRSPGRPFGYRAPQANSGRENKGTSAVGQVRFIAPHHLTNSAAGRRKSATVAAALDSRLADDFGRLLRAFGPRQPTHASP